MMEYTIIIDVAGPYTVYTSIFCNPRLYMGRTTIPRVLEWKNFHPFQILFVLRFLELSQYYKKWTHRYFTHFTLDDWRYSGFYFLTLSLLYYAEWIRRLSWVKKVFYIYYMLYAISCFTFTRNGTGRKFINLTEVR